MNILLFFLFKYQLISPTKYSIQPTPLYRKSKNIDVQKVLKKAETYGCFLQHNLASQRTKVESF